MASPWQTGLQQGREAGHRKGADLESTAVDQLAIPAEGATPLQAWGRLRILEHIGQGGFGEVYRAYDPSLETEVALKLWRPDRSRAGPAERFLREARRLARVRHPNVLVVHGADEHEGRVGMWTELLRGKTLDELLAQQGPFAAHEAALVGIELCRALAAVHAEGLVHGDLKPSNVMREQRGRIVLMDFGSVVDQPSSGRRPENQSAGGTPLYMAPEVLRGEAPAPSSDLYALGALLYRLVSGRLPLEARDLPELLARHERQERVPLRSLRPDLPTAFVQVVERALDSDPGQRYASAGEMELALAGSLGAQVPAPSQEAGAGWPRIERRVWLAIAASLAAGVLIGIAWRLWAPAPLRVEATLYRVSDGLEERLQPGARVRPGDRLFLEIEAEERTHAYVLNEDARGNSFVLFPLPGMDLGNPLEAGAHHRLPGPRAGRQMTWEVTSAGGREVFMVVASRKPLDFLEEELAQLPRAGEATEVVQAPVDRIPPPAARGTGGLTVRGIGGLTQADMSGAGATAGRLQEIERILSERAGRRSSIWLWQIELDNPGP